MTSFVLIGSITGALHIVFMVLRAVGVVCSCRGFRDAGIAAVLAGIAAFAVAAGGVDNRMGAAAFWFLIGAMDLSWWWRDRNTCDHNNKRGKRIKARVKSWLPKPKVITRLAPTS